MYPVNQEAVDGQAAQEQTSSKKPTAATTSGCSSSARAVKVHRQKAGQQFQGKHARMEVEATWLFYNRSAIQRNTIGSPMYDHNEGTFRDRPKQTKATGLLFLPSLDFIYKL